MKISAIIPTYNRVVTLQRALDSVLQQTYLPSEIIIVDDGSTDQTVELVKAKYPTVTLIHQQNRGVSAARNAGIQKATGDWIALLDSDDEWLPEKLQTQVSALRANPEFKFCHTDEIWIRNGQRVNPKKKHKKFGGDVFLQSLPLCIISPSAVLIHREYFERFGVFDASLPVCEDYDLWLRICAFEPVLFVKQKLLIKYGGHSDQLSHRYWGMDRFRIQSMVKLLMDPNLEKIKKEHLLVMLLNKLEIYIQGCVKHRNDEEYNRYSPLTELIKNNKLEELRKWEETWKVPN